MPPSTTDRIFPFFIALRDLLANVDRDWIRTCPSLGRHGLIDVLPLHSWIPVIEKTSAEGEKENVLSSESPIATIRTCIPGEFINYLLRPLVSTQLVHSCMVPQVPVEYKFRIENAESRSEEEKRYAIYGLVAYCIQCYLGAFLARGENAVDALAYPGSSDLNLSLQQRLCLGIVREYAILPRFPSLQYFWDTFARIRDIGRFYVGVHELGGGLQPARVFQLVGDDQDLISMYQIVLQVSCHDGSLEAIYRNMSYYRMHEMQDTIGDPFLTLKMENMDLY